MVASREAAKRFLIYFLHCIDIIWKILRKKEKEEKNLENVKKYLPIRHL